VVPRSHLCARGLIFTCPIGKVDGGAPRSTMRMLDPRAGIRGQPYFDDDHGWATTSLEWEDDSGWEIPTHCAWEGRSGLWMVLGSEFL
jgi:hypothetical protein